RAPRAEDMRHRRLGGRVEAHGEGVNPAPALLHDGLPRVLAQIAGIRAVDVGGLAVGEHEDQATLPADAGQAATRVAKGGAHAGGEPRGQLRERPARRAAPGRIELLEAVVLDVMAAVRREAVDGEQLASAREDLAEQHGGSTLEIYHSSGKVRAVRASAR